MEKRTKHIIFAALGAGALFAAYKFIFNKKKPIPPSSGAGVSGSGLLIKSDPNSNNYGIRGGGQSLDFKQLADNLFYAFDGWGTNNVVAINTFDYLRSDEEFDKLVEAYGTRTISSGAGNIFQSDFTGDLFGAINSELSATQIGYINTILSGNGLTRKF